MNPIISQALNRRMQEIEREFLDSIKNYPKDTFETKRTEDAKSPRLLISGEAFTSYFINHHITPLKGVNYLIKPNEGRKGKRLVISISLQ